MMLGDNFSIINDDCMNILSKYEDDYFDLAIVDPPYGFGNNSGIHAKGGGKLKNRILNKNANKFIKWDKKPSKEYFNELFRVSKNQIIWGGNYFDLPPYRCVIVWDKCQPFPNFSAVEIAWTSFEKPASLYKYDNKKKRQNTSYTKTKRIIFLAIRKIFSTI